MTIEYIDGTPTITLTDSGAFSVVRWITDTSTMSSIAGSTPGGAGPMLSLDAQSCLKVGDKTFVSHLAGGCDKGLYGCGTVKSVAGSLVGVEMAEVAQNALTGNGTANGAIAKSLNISGWIGVLAIYSHLPSEPSPSGLTGAVDKGSSTVLVSGGSPGDVAPGDRISLPSAGITAATVRSVQAGTKGSTAYLVATIDQVAQTSIAPSAPAPLSRQGQLLSYTKLTPVGDGSCGQLTGSIDLRDIRKLPSAAACGCNPCQPLREVGCYSITLIRGIFNTPGSGYPLYSSSAQFTAEVGKVLMVGSIAPDLDNIRA